MIRNVAMKNDVEDQFGLLCVYGYEHIMIRNVAMKNDVEDQFVPLCEKHRRSTQRKKGKEPSGTSKWRKANWIGHISRGDCLLKLFTEGKEGYKWQEDKELPSETRYLRKDTEND